MTHPSGSRVTLLRLLLDAIPLALAVFDGGQKLVAANRRYAELTEIPEGALRNRELHDASPNALADLGPQIAAVKRDGHPASRLIEFRKSAGPRTVEVTIAPFGSTEDGWLFIGLDVTEREELRRTLARNVEELEAIFATIPDSVRVFAADGTVVRLNAQARSAHGEATPMSVSDLWQTDHPRGPDGHVLFMHEHPAARALTGESVRSQQLVLKRTGSETTLDVNAEPLRASDGRLRGAVTVDRDVTDKAQLARELGELVRARESEAARLEQLVEERSRQLLALQEDREKERRLAAVGQLAAGVMHDVNNVLNPILAAAYLVDSYAEDTIAVREYAQRIAHAAEMGVSTLGRLRRFIRQEPIHEKSEGIVDLAPEIDAVLALAAPVWEGRDPSRAVVVERNLGSGVVIRGQAADLRAAVLNLVHNALDAMPNGGTLAVTAALRNDAAVVEVRDTGVGMPPEVRQHAFEPFYTTKGSRGTGLGLAEVYGIVKRHRGFAEIESELGVGTVVRLRFPLATTVG